MIPKLEMYKEHVNITSATEIKPGLAAIERAMKALGSPEQQLKAIHVAGTNGKGSTIAFMESILQEEGLTTGVFASPAVIDIHDQIRLNGENSSPEQLTASFQAVKDAGLDGELTDFELLTAVAFVTFARLQPDVVLIECGMGGRFDSTNVVIPIVSVISSVAIDHVGFLGNSFQEIAWHKTGIFKKGVPAVCGDLPEEAVQVAEKAAGEMNSPIRYYGRDFKMGGTSEEFYEGFRHIDLPERKMKGPHQATNAAVAVDALLSTELSLSDEAIRRGIQNTQVPYRFEQIAENVYVDGAHNPAAAKMLASTIQQQFPGETVDFVIGMMANKDIQATLNELIPAANSFTFIDFDVPGAASAQQMYDLCEFGKKQMTNGKDMSIILTNEPGKKKIVSGSLYLLNSLKTHIL